MKMNNWQFIENQQLDFDGKTLYKAIDVLESTFKDIDINCLQKLFIDDKLYIGCGKDLTVFNHDCTIQFLNVPFDDTITYFEVPPKGKCVVICLKNGTVVLMDKITGGIIKKFYVFENIIKCFTQVFEDILHMYFISDMGKCMQVTNEMYEVKEIFDISGSVNCACMKEYYLIIAFNTHLFIYNTQKKRQSSINIYQELQKMFYKEKHLLLCLTKGGNLIYIALNTYLIYYFISETSYVDINLIMREDNVEVLYLLKKDKMGRKFLELRKLHNFQEMFSMILENDVDIIPSNNLLNYICYKTNSITIGQIREVTPFKYYMNYIKQKLYEKAESFAKQFNLNLDLLAEARINDILTKEYIKESDIKNILALLGAFESDYEYKLNTIVAIIKKGHDNLENLKPLFLAAKSVIKNIDEIPSEQITMNINQLNEIEHKFCLFSDLVHIKAYRMDNWTEFHRKDILNEFFVHLQNDNIEAATIICTQLDTHHIKRITPCIIRKWLDLIDYSHTNRQLFYSICLLIINYFPNILAEFCDIYVRMIKKAESNSKAFPSDMIRATENLMKLKSSLNLEMLSVFLVTLNEILNALRDIEDIGMQLKINVQFENVYKNSRNLIKYLIHSKSTKEELLMNYVHKYIMKNSLDINIILYEEINILMLEESHDKIVLLLNFISDIELKQKIISNLLLYSYPWNDKLRKLATIHGDYSKLIKDCLELEDLLDVIHKYELKNVDVYDMFDISMATKRILYCNKPYMLEDIYKLCICKEHREDVNAAIVKHFIENNNELELLDWLNWLQKDEMLQVCSQINIMNEISFRRANGARSFHIDLMKSVYGLYAKASSVHLQSYILDDFEVFKSLRILQDTFGICTNLSKIRVSDDGSRDNLCNELLLKITNSFDMANVHSIVDLLHLIAKTLKFSDRKIFAKYCDMLDCEDIRELVMYMCDTNTFEYVWDVTVFLIKKTTQNDLDENTLLDFSINAQPQNDVEEIKKTSEVLRRLIEKALTDDNDLLKRSKLAVWLQPLFYATENAEKSNFPMCNKYYTKILPVTVKSFKVFSQMFCRHVSSDTCIREMNISPENFTRELNELSAAIFGICNDGQELFAYHLVYNLETEIGNLNVSTNVNEKITKPVVNILSKRILQSDNIDYEFICSLIIRNCPNIWQFIHNNLKIYKSNPNKFNFIANLGCRLVNNIGAKEYLFCKYLLLTYKWWTKCINSKGMHYTELHTMQPKTILDYLLENRFITTDQLNEFCIDFKLSLQESLLLNLQKVLINWQIDYQIIDKAIGKVLVIISREDDLFDQCMHIVNKIDNKAVLLKELAESYKHINNYYYEAYLCILRIMNILEPSQDVTDKETLLRFLLRHRRISEPSPTEFSHDSQNACDLAEFRIPFLDTFFTNKVFNFIKKEINLDTYKNWFEVLPILKHLTKDDICIEALRNIDSAETNVECSAGKYEKLISQIKICVNYATKKEPAISVLYYLVQKMPYGMHKYFLAELCFKYISDCENSCDLKLEEIREIKTQILKLYHACKITNILTSHQLNDKIYLEKINDVRRLITDMYGDERIIARNEALLPDINMCTEEIAHFAEIDIQSIRVRLVHDLLETETEITYEKSPNMLRLLYIFKSGNVDFWQKHLLHMFNEKTYDLFHRAKALECLCSISNEEFLNTNVRRNSDDLKKYINKLMIIHKLKYFGLDMKGTEELDAQNKSKICFMLNRYKNLNANSLMALICLTYEIYASKFWKAIFKLAITLKSWKNLLYYLKIIRLKIVWYDEEFYVEAWQITLENWFDWQRKDGEDSFVEYSLLIQSCPVVGKIDFVNILNKLCLKKNYVQAALLLNRCDEKDVKYYAQLIANNHEDFESKLETSVKYFYNVDIIKTILKKYSSE